MILIRLAQDAESSVRQNAALDIHEEYFDQEDNSVNFQHLKVK